MNATQCPCPRLCRSTEYRESISVAYFPSDVARIVLDRMQLVDSDSSRWVGVCVTSDRSRWV